MRRADGSVLEIYRAGEQESGPIGNPVQHWKSLSDHSRFPAPHTWWATVSSRKSLSAQSCGRLAIR